MPEMVLSPSVLLLFRSQFQRAPLYCRKTINFGFLYLVLEVFTCTSIAVQNPITSVFKVRRLSATGFFQWLITLATRIIVPQDFRRFKALTLHPTHECGKLCSFFCKVCDRVLFSPEQLCNKGIDQKQRKSL